MAGVWRTPRTTMAWHRTVLSLAVASAVLARFDAERLGPWALVPLVASVSVLGWIVVWGGARRASPSGLGRTRTSVTLTTVLVCSLGLVALAGVLLR